MRNKIYYIFLIFFTLISIERINAQGISAVSLLSSDIIFLKTEVVKSNNRRVPGSKYVQHVITYYEYDYYLLKVGVKINENIDAPLEIKLISPSEKENIYRVEESIKMLEKDDFRNYTLEIKLEETGWYKLEIGDYTKNTNGIIQNIVFDKSIIYVKK